MSTKLTQYDHYLTNSGPAALVIREYLVPVEGADGVLFPPTFAAGDGFAGGYNIDGDPKGENIALIDSVGSQANRIEPMFAEPDYTTLVPQVVIKAGAKSVSLLQAGHRAGDAIVRCSALQQELQDAFKKVLDGDASALAKIAPTSLVFGVWDSRDTQAKMPRLVSSTIRAFNVMKLTRSAQFVPATDYIGGGLLDEPADKATKDSYSERGFVHVPATASHGGVIAKGGIRRDATLALTALNLISAGSDKNATLALRRYILGLALVAFTRLPAGYLRQGTILVSDPDKPRQTNEVYPTGERKVCTVTHEAALEYAKEAAKAFGVGSNREVEFDTERAKKDLLVKEGKAGAKAKKTK
ncbi:MAG: type I-U CRISPR-associated protein Cas7 [Opitutaceae bacterium]|nr:type I-U CRISPR-associated protein Cas7 [Opitutaceae bacterium]